MLLSSRTRKKSFPSSLSLFMIDARPENFSTRIAITHEEKTFLPHLTGVFLLAHLLFMDQKTTELSIWCWARVVKVSPQTRMEKVSDRMRNFRLLEKFIIHFNHYLMRWDFWAPPAAAKVRTYVSIKLLSSCCYGPQGVENKSRNCFCLRFAFQSQHEHA